MGASSWRPVPPGDPPIRSAHRSVRLGSLPAGPMSGRQHDGDACHHEQRRPERPARRAGPGPVALDRQDEQGRRRDQRLDHDRAALLHAQDDEHEGRRDEQRPDEQPRARSTAARRGATNSSSVTTAARPVRTTYVSTTPTCMSAWSLVTTTSRPWPPAAAMTRHDDPPATDLAEGAAEGPAAPPRVTIAAATAWIGHERAGQQDRGEEHGGDRAERRGGRGRRRRPRGRTCPRPRWP